MSSDLLFLLQLNLVWWHIFISWIVLWKDWIALLWSRPRSQKRSKIPVNVQLDDIPSTAKPSVTKLGMVMHHHGPESHARRLICCLQVKGHSEGSYNRVRLYQIYWTTDLFATTFNWIVHHHILTIALWLTILLCTERVGWGWGYVAMQGYRPCFLFLLCSQI